MKRFGLGLKMTRTKWTNLFQFAAFARPAPFFFVHVNDNRCAYEQMIIQPHHPQWKMHVPPHLVIGGFHLLEGVWNVLHPFSWNLIGTYAENITPSV